MEPRPRWIDMTKRAAWWVAAAVLLVAVFRIIGSGNSGLVAPVDTATGTAATDLESVPAPAGDSSKAVEIADSLFGWSGALRFRALTAAEALALRGFVPRFG